MNEVNEKYFALLEKGMLDKVWFLEKIEHSVNTLVDFGCGDGSLFTIIDRIYPGRFRYIGIDHDEKMIALAKENGIEIYSSLDELPEIDYGKSALILNSVLHEIFSYSAFNVAYELFEQMAAKEFRHIAIRDMCLNRKDKLPNYTKEIMDSAFAEQYQQFMEINPDTIYPDIADYKVLTLEFLLKYRYEQNREKEKSAVYLCSWHAHIPEIFTEYTKEFDSTFRVPYIIRQIRNDFGIDLQFDTHRKMLLTRL